MKTLDKLLLDRAENKAMFFTIEEAKETALDISQGNLKIL